MGRYSANSMSNSLIYTGEQDWSDWEKWKELEKDARRVRLTGPRYRLICALKNDYRDTGHQHTREYAELRELVDKMYLRQFSK